ncbi:MAG: hypothetical protein Q7S00_01415 [bacterium]|nr:hypothetical protein [bacterium]
MTNLLKPVNDRVKFESKTYDLSPPRPRKNIFAGLVRGVGNVMAPVGYALGFTVFPPALAIGAGGTAMSQMGALSQQKSMEKSALQNMPSQPVATSYPGLNTNGYMATPGGGAVDTEVMGILSAKQNTMNVMSQNPGGS